MSPTTTAPPPPPPPMTPSPRPAVTSGRLHSQPVLRPGTRVFRRDDAHLQVGLDQLRVVLADTDGIRSLLRELERGEGLTCLTPEAGLALDRLVDAGAVVERAELVEALRDDRRGTAAALFAARGPEAPRRLTDRAACRVAVVACEPWLALAVDRIATAGLETARLEAPGEEAPAVTLVVTAGEPARSHLDRLVREDRPHLLVTLLPELARLGPFVVPGATACLRCIDAHLAERDPRRGLVLEQLEAPGPVAPCDPLLAQAATCLAVRELATYAEGERPATWSATLTVDADLSLSHRAWPRHPHCGCSWG